jgi:flagellar biosynthesis regulator FlaF
LTTETIDSFQVYGQAINGNLNILVDRMWIENRRVYFRVIKVLSKEENYLRRENRSNIYSIDEKHLYSIRTRIYF